MVSLESLLKMPRGRAVLKDVNDGTRRLMPCGDQRLASLLMRFGAIRVVNGKERRYTNDYVITPLGQTHL